MCLLTSSADAMTSLPKPTIRSAGVLFGRVRRAMNLRFVVSL